MGHKPHANRIDLFKGYLASVAKLSRPFQIFSQTIYAGDADDVDRVKSFAYVIKSDKDDVATLVQELSGLRHSTSIKFYPWKEYKDEMKLEDKRQIINDMINSSLGHASLVFKGVTANEYMRIRNTKRTKDTQEVAESAEVSNNMDTEGIATEHQKDLEFSHIRCMEYMQKYFVNSDRVPIFHSILGPYNNLIEVTFHQGYFNNVRIIEKQFITILASKMTDTSIEKCFSPWPIPLTPETLRNPWTPPKAVNSIIQHQSGTNPYRNSTSNIGYALVSYHSTSTTLSYKDATALGVRQVDIPATHVVNSISTNSPNNPTSTNDNTTSISSLTSSQIWLDMEEKQRKYQEQNDLNIRQLRTTMSGVEAESKAATKSVDSLRIEVKAKYTELQDTIKKSTRQSEERIAQNIEHKSAIQSEENGLTQKMLKEFMMEIRLERTQQLEIRNNDTYKQNSTHSEIQNPGSDRTHHPPEQNNNNNHTIIHPSSRTNHHSNERVAALVN